MVNALVVVVIRFVTDQRHFLKGLLEGFGSVAVTGTDLKLLK